MTLQELSICYEESAEKLRIRLRQLRQALANATDPEEIWHLKRRIADLSPMLTQMNDLAELTAHYYDRGITAVKNILYDGYLGPRLPREVQLKRIKMVIDSELTPLQRETLMAYYIHRQTIPKIAEARGVHKSTVSRTLKRAEKNLRKYLKY